MPIYLTERGKQLLEKKVRDLNAELDIVHDEKLNTRSIWNDGGVSELALLQMEQIEQELSVVLLKVECILSHGEIVTVGKRDTDVAAIGSIVRYRLESFIPAANEEHCFELAGYGESDREEKKMSCYTPIGKALMGLKAGETGEIELPGGRMMVSIEKLYADWAEVET